jgi:hypothetical protein
MALFPGKNNKKMKAGDKYFGLFAYYNGVGNRRKRDQRHIYLDYLWHSIAEILMHLFVGV